MHATPRAEHTNGIRGLAAVPPCSWVTTGHCRKAASAITKGSARPRPVPVFVSLDDRLGHRAPRGAALASSAR
jgi:hypothetical protein